MDARFLPYDTDNIEAVHKALGLERAEEEGRWAALQPTSRQACRPKFLPRNPQLVLLGWSCMSALFAPPGWKDGGAASGFGPF